MASLGTWPRGVTVSTLDSESSDRGSNPREVSLIFLDQHLHIFMVSHHPGK